MFDFYEGFDWTAFDRGAENARLKSNYNIDPPQDQVNDVLKRLGLKVQGE